jgi:hypothetical protein
MGFLDRIRTQTDGSAPGTHITRSDPARESVVQNELLLSLSRRDIDDSFREFWNPLVGPIDPYIQQFFQSGLIQDATLADRLDSAFRVKDLKPILESRGVKPKGNKPDLIRLVLENIPADEVRSMVPMVTRYRATDAGSVQIEAFRQWKKSDREAAELNALQLLRSKNLRGAEGAADEYRGRQLQPSCLGERQLEAAKTLLSMGYEDLSVSSSQRFEVACRMALEALFGSTDCEGAILEICGGAIPCPDLISFMANPCGMAKGYSADSPGDLAALYVHTKTFHATFLSDLKEMYAETREIAKGVEILYVDGEPCPICNRGKHKYRWSEINDMPTLPRHWGCRCVLCAWI